MFSFIFHKQYVSNVNLTLAHRTSILDYKVFIKMVKRVEEDPELDKKQAAKALGKFISLHPHNIAQKTEVIIERFRECRLLQPRLQTVSHQSNDLISTEFIEHAQRTLP